MMTQSEGVPFTAKRFSETWRRRRGSFERQRVRDAGLVALGRHDPDVVGQGPGDALQGFESRRVDAVVVGDQDAHQLFSPSIFSMPPM